MSGHAAGCFLDGIMTATGCTYGKSNIEKLYYNKMAFALINVAILVGASIFIVYEAVIRFQHPEPVLGRIVVILAGVGILGNGFSAWLLNRDSKDNLNMWNSKESRDHHRPGYDRL